jgi:hypothetical protein
MPLPNEISQNRELLRLAKQRRHHYLKQRATLGEAYEPPGVAAGISDAEQEIAKLEARLHDMGASAEDQGDGGGPPPAPDSAAPFIVGPPVPPERFYGRFDQRRRLAQCLRGTPPRSVILLGYYRSGKTSLLRYLLARPGEFFAPDQRPLLVELNFSAQTCATPQDVSEALRRGIAEQHGQPPWPAEASADPHRIEAELRRLRAAGWRLVVLIDEFQKIADRGAVFKEWGGDWRAHTQNQLLSLVIASALPINDVYRTMGGTSPFGNDFASPELLGPLEQPAANALLAAGFAAAGRPLLPAELLLADELSGGMPFYFQLAGETILREPELTSARYAFADNAEPHLRALWQTLAARDQALLRQAVAGSQPDQAHAYRLRKRGLLRSNGQPFSTAFAELIRGGEL